MSTQQDIYAFGSENRPPMLNKENYVTWPSRLLRYAKRRPNGKLIYNSIINGPYVEANDQAIQTILLCLPEDIYASVDICETAQEIWLRVQQMMKGSDIGIQEKKAKLFNEWERFTSTNGESIESYYHRFSKLMNDFKRNKHFLEKIANYTQLYDFLKYNQKEVDDLKAERHAKTHDLLELMTNSNNPFNYQVFHQDQPSPNPTTVMNMELVLMAKAFKLNYSTPTNNNQRISSNPRNRQIAQPVQNVGNQVVQNAVQNLGVQNGLIVVPGIANQNPNGNGNVVVARTEGNAIGNNGNQIRCYNCRGLGHLARNCTVKPRRRDAAYLPIELLIAQKEEAGIQLQAEEFDLMAAAADFDEIEEVNANCILMANLQQVSTSGTQTDKAPVYDSDGSAENDSNVISEVSNVEQSGGTVDQHPTTVEETHAYFESLYNNLAIEVEKINSVNRRMKETNADLTTELAGYKNQEKCFEISQEKYDKLERSFKGNEEKKKLKSDFKIRKDELLDKQIHLENKIKELDNILVKMGQSIQTMHMLSPKPDSFYHTEHKMSLGYQNPFYLKQAQQKQQSLYDGKILLEKHDPPAVYDSEETL
ncbi:retrovirus-related pol polyprotein from transposon TNT 1-94 [Tanacetum coccineum]